MNAPIVPAVLKRRFPVGQLVPFPSPMNVAPGCIAIGRLPMYPRTLRALAFRFLGKRLRGIDVRRIELRTCDRSIWLSDASLARMLDLYRDFAPVRRYAFVDLTEPDSGCGGLPLYTTPSGFHVELELSPEAREPRIDWWGVFS